ncbi:hypothetical protein CRUP_025792 [Coryphaenoides rupestris]|nr:hypothetical protein CRUP_025792 [Coryphaenoides rupestris]
MTSGGQVRYRTGEVFVRLSYFVLGSRAQSHGRRPVEQGFYSALTRDRRIMEVLFQVLFSPLPTTAIVSLFALAAATLFYLNTRPAPLRSPADLKCQTIGIEGGARKSALLEDNNNLLSYYYEDGKTLYEVFQRGLKVSGNGPCLGYRKLGRPYQWLKYKQVVSDRAEHLGSGLLHRGLKPNADTFVGIFAQNRPEWIIGELACYTYSMVVVPLYDTLGSEALTFIIDRADISTVLCDKQTKAESLLQSREEGQTPALKTIVVMDPFDEALATRGGRVEVIFNCCSSSKPPKPEDLSIICFTSGTTGNPKGAMLTHENVVSDAAAVVKTFEATDEPSPKDVSISFLPLAHMFERVVQVQSGANTAFKKWLLNFAVERKYAEVKEGIIRKNSVWDKLLFHKVQESLGGRVRIMVTGAAPISPAVLNFLRATLGCQVCIKGRNVFKGYLKDPEKTAEALDEDGWLHTGDIGKWMPSGVLKIVDRKKNIFKLAQGEYIAPEKIENVYVRSEMVAQVFVHGESLQSCLIGIVIPDPDSLPGFAKKLGLTGSIEELCKKTDFFLQEMKKAVLTDLTKLGREAGLKSFEQVKAVHLHPEQFTIENGLLTPTLKAKRTELKTLFQPQIETLYANMQ